MRHPAGDRQHVAVRIPEVGCVEIAHTIRVTARGSNRKPPRVFISEYVPITAGDSNAISVSAASPAFGLAAFCTCLRHQRDGTSVEEREFLSR